MAANILQGAAAQAGWITALDCAGRCEHMPCQSSACAAQSACCLVPCSLPLTLYTAPRLADASGSHGCSRATCKAHVWAQQVDASWATVFRESNMTVQALDTPQKYVSPVAGALTRVPTHRLIRHHRLQGLAQQAQHTSQVAIHNSKTACLSKGGRMKGRKDKPKASGQRREVEMWWFRAVPCRTVAGIHTPGVHPGLSLTWATGMSGDRTMRT
jgi:hypothetical protein